MAESTQIIPPRVAFLDPRTNLISREWYRFFLNLFTDVMGNVDGVDMLGTAPASNVGEINKASQDAHLASIEAKYDTLTTIVQGAYLAPPYVIVPSARSLSLADVAPVYPPTVSIGTMPPITITADYTVLDTDRWIINNKASACVVTLPPAALWAGRSITFQNDQAYTLSSNASNVVPQGGGAAGTAILLAVVGNWATLVSNGTNWVIMQAAAFNNLILE